MSKMPRRDFLKLVGKGAAGLAVANTLGIKAFGNNDGVGRVYNIDGIPEGYRFDNPADAAYAFLDMVEYVRRNPQDSGRLLTVMGGNEPGDLDSTPLSGDMQLFKRYAEKLIASRPTTVKNIKIEEIQNYPPHWERKDVWVGINGEFDHKNPDFRVILRSVNSKYFASTGNFPFLG